MDTYRIICHHVNLGINLSIVKVGVQYKKFIQTSIIVVVFVNIRYTFLVLYPMSIVVSLIIFVCKEHFKSN